MHRGRSPGVREGLDGPGGSGGLRGASVPCLCGGVGAVTALLEPGLAVVGRAVQGLVVPWRWCVLP